tara:strand:- start:42 stop:671 length:630 start_codon:yes stop_codon:yes gene_type:complete
MLYLLNKKGSMFGLDARIALAIFGALSVISGASLYFAIQESKAVSLLAQMNEVGKAWEQYYLDTGENLPKYGSDNSKKDFYELLTSNLVKDKGINNWKGPYLPYKANDSYDHVLDHSIYRYIIIRTLSYDDSWGGALGPWDINNTCLSGKNCSLDVMIDGQTDDSLANIIDLKVDSGDGASDGNFRWWLSGDSYYRYHLNYASIKNPND